MNIRFVTMIAAVAGTVCVASADTTENMLAQTTGTYWNSGRRTGTNGDFFFDVEGAIQGGSFASYGVVRWDLTGARAQFDAAYGAGQWHITAVELELTQDNAAFSNSGLVQMYYSTDDTTNIGAPVAGLAFPFFDSPGVGDLALGNGGNPILSYTFTLSTSGDVDRYTQTGSLKNGISLSPAEVLTLAPDMVQHITTTNAVTFVLVDNDPSVSATYHGWTLGTLGRNPPNLFVTAAANTIGTCYANCDGSTSTPLLNVADFTCFLQKFAQGDAYANCDGSTSVPLLNVADFTCFLQKFAQGCP